METVDVPILGSSYDIATVGSGSVNGMQLAYNGGAGMRSYVAFNCATAGLLTLPANRGVVRHQ